MNTNTTNLKTLREQANKLNAMVKNAKNQAFVDIFNFLIEHPGEKFDHIALANMVDLYPKDLINFACRKGIMGKSSVGENNINLEIAINSDNEDEDKQICYFFHGDLIIEAEQVEVHYTADMPGFPPIIKNVTLFNWSLNNGERWSDIVCKIPRIKMQGYYKI